MTTRETIAAMAMQGMLTGESSDESYDVNLIAWRSVVFADALIAQLAETPPKAEEPRIGDVVAYYFQNPLRIFGNGWYCDTMRDDNDIEYLKDANEYYIVKRAKQEAEEPRIGWISVKKLLPCQANGKPEDLGFLVFRPKAKRKIDVCFTHSAWWKHDDGSSQEITHWMPLPVPPYIDERAGEAGSGEAGGGGTMKTVKDIVLEYLEANGYDGLYSSQWCSCGGGHLFEYCSCAMNCVPAFKHLCNKCKAENCEDRDILGGCYKPEKQEAEG